MSSSVGSGKFNYFEIVDNKGFSPDFSLIHLYSYQIYQTFVLLFELYEDPFYLIFEIFIFYFESILKR